MGNSELSRDEKLEAARRFAFSRQFGAGNTLPRMIDLRKQVMKDLESQFNRECAELVKRHKARVAEAMKRLPEQFRALKQLAREQRAEERTARLVGGPAARAVLWRAKRVSGGVAPEDHGDGA
jgi:hypothetical protein